MYSIAYIDDFFFLFFFSLQTTRRRSLVCWMQGRRYGLWAPWTAYLLGPPSVKIVFGGVGVCGCWWVAVEITFFSPMVDIVFCVPHVKKLKKAVLVPLIWNRIPALVFWLAICLIWTFRLYFSVPVGERVPKVCQYFQRRLNWTFLAIWSEVSTHWQISSTCQVKNWCKNLTHLRTYKKVVSLKRA